MSKFNNAAIRTLALTKIKTVKEARLRFNEGEVFMVDCLCNKEIDGETVTKADYDAGEYANVFFRNKLGFEQSISIKVK